MIAKLENYFIFRTSPYFQITNKKTTLEICIKLVTHVLFSDLLRSLTDAVPVLL